jgi:3-oxoacyl-[acyl-carrier-protein] synthase III
LDVLDGLKVLQANAYIKSGMAQRLLVIGSETLSRVVDKHDRIHDLFRWCRLQS